MWFGVISLFPEMFRALYSGVTGRAIEKKLVALSVYNPRDYTTDKHKHVDDKPFGGGPGMVMMAQPLRDAILAARLAAPQSPKVIYLSPQGKPYSQKIARTLHETSSAVIFVAGRYEGIDQRVVNQEIDEEWSVGDYVVSGGELPCLLILDSLIRLIPGALGDEESALQDSFSEDLLDYPHYTRPQDATVPSVLYSGDHAAIARWRRKQQLGMTWLKRPDLLSYQTLQQADKILLQEFLVDYAQTIGDNP